MKRLNETEVRVKLGLFQGPAGDSTNADLAAAEANAAALEARNAATEARSAANAATTSASGVDGAVSAANSAASKATGAAGNAATAASAANSAAASANTAANSASAAAAQAQSATENAVYATNQANAAANAANTAEDSARNAASSANSAAAQAVTAATAANSAAEDATDAAGEANNAANRANTEANAAAANTQALKDIHPQAVAATDAANTAASNANAVAADSKTRTDAAVANAEAATEKATTAAAQADAAREAVQGDIGQLKDTTADLLMGMPHKEALELRSGIVHNGGNIDSPQDGANTCYAYKYIPKGKGYSVEFDSSVYTVAAAFFTEEKKYVNVVGFFTTQSPYILPKNAQNSPYVVVEFRRKDGATITEDEAAALGAALNYPVYPGTRRIITLTEDVYEQFIVTQDCDIIGNGYEVSLGVELDDGSNSGVFSVAYEAAEGTCTHRVFVTKDLEVENTTASRPYYYVTLWSIAEDTANDKILTPLMTEGEVNATPDSFTYNGTAFVINSTGHKRIVMAQDYEVNGPGELRYGLYINGAYNVNVYNAKFNFAGMYGARISNGANVNFYNCEFGYAKTASGLYAIDSVVNCFGCIANHNRNDGFNYHNTGEGLAVECSGSYNADDGISNHDSFALRINGGRFIGNGKGGVACPTHGAACDIANVYCSGNQAGIYAVSDTATSETVIVQGALLKDNTYPFWIKNYDVIAVNVAMVNNINEARIDSGSLTEY